MYLAKNKMQLKLVGIRFCTPVSKCVKAGSPLKSINLSFCNIMVTVVALISRACCKY